MFTPLKRKIDQLQKSAERYEKLAYQTEDDSQIDYFLDLANECYDKINELQNAFVNSQ